MDKNYYKDYYHLERKHWWFVVREKIIIHIFKKFRVENKVLKILNVGCATGRSTEYLSQFGEVTSIEYDQDCCVFLKEELKIDVINASATELPFADEQYDWVCAFDVIEHIEDHQKAVQELCRVTKKNGQVYITVPAFMSMWNNHDVINQHFRRYRMPELKALFISEKNGKILYNTYFNFILFPLIWIFRKISVLLASENNKKELKSDFDNPDENKIKSFVFYNLFYMEKFLLNYITFPVGVSAMIIWKKNK